MEPDGGEWIRAESLGGDEGLGRDDGWPEAGSPEAGSPTAAASAAAPGKGWGHGGVPGFSGWAAAAMAVVAAAAGVGVGLSLIGGAPSAGAVGGAIPSASAVAPGGSAGTLRVVLTGQVLAVSHTSITIGGAGPAVTAAVTGATTISGSVRGIDGVKPGDEVSAQLTGTVGKLVATAIQDPARA